MTATYKVEDEAVHYARAERRRRKREHNAEEDARDREFLVPHGREPSDVWAAVEDWNRGVMPSNDTLVRLLAMGQAACEDIGRKVSAESTREAVHSLARTAELWQQAVKERNADGLLQRFVAHLRMALRNAAAEATMARSGRLRIDEHFSLLGRSDWAGASLHERVGQTLRTAASDARALLLVAQLLLTSAPFVAHVSTAASLLERLFAVGQLDATHVSNAHQPPKARAKKLSIEVYPPGAVANSTSTRDAMSILSDARPLFEAMHKAPAHKDALNALLGVARRTHETAEAAQSLVAAMPTAGAHDANITAARNDLVQIAARFAGGHSPLGALNATRALLSTVPSPGDLAERIEHGTTEDGTEHSGDVVDDVSDIIADAGVFLTRCLADATFVASDEYTRRGTRLVERATTGTAASVLRRRANNAIEEWRAYAKAWMNDPLTAALAGEAGRLAGSLPALAASGAARSDIRDVLLPAALSLAHAVPLPHVEAGDPKRGIRIALDGVYVPVSMLAPRVASLRTTGTLRARGASPGGARRPGARNTRLRPGVPAAWRTGFHVRLAGMAGSIAPVRFTLARRTFPRIRDRGRVDVRICGTRGLSIVTDVDTGDTSINTPPSSANESFLVPRRVAVKISRVRLRFHGVRHAFLFGAAKPFIERRVRRSLERAICERIVSSVRLADSLARLAMRGIS